MIAALQELAEPLRRAVESARVDVYNAQTRVATIRRALRDAQEQLPAKLGDVEWFNTLSATFMPQRLQSVAQEEGAKSLFERVRGCLGRKFCGDLSCLCSVKHIKCGIRCLWGNMS